eukprot:scaffold241214_cov28-Prasinocladus_malaysianus.AAC.1
MSEQSRCPAQSGGGSIISSQTRVALRTLFHIQRTVIHRCIPQRWSSRQRTVQVAGGPSQTKDP